MGIFIITIFYLFIYLFIFIFFGGGAFFRIGPKYVKLQVLSVLQKRFHCTLDSYETFCLNTINKCVKYA